MKRLTSRKIIQKDIFSDKVLQDGQLQVLIDRFTVLVFRMIR